MIFAGFSLNINNPNPGGSFANMTFKTQNCCDKFIIHKEKLKQFVNHTQAICGFAISRLSKKELALPRFKQYMYS
jgi:hypothetical protein